MSLCTGLRRAPAGPNVLDTESASNRVGRIEPPAAALAPAACRRQWPRSSPRGEEASLDRGYRTYASSVAPSTTRVVLWLIALNVAVFILQRFFLDKYVDLLGLVPAYFLGRAFLWQIVTYMFLHASVLHIFFNMLFLWMMGSESSGTGEAGSSSSTTW